MSDEGTDYKCCPHCNSVEELTHFTFNDYRGDGLCKLCEGRGWIDDSFTAEVTTFVSRVITLGFDDTEFPDKIDCPKCDGNGQCKTCGGNGRVKRKRFEDIDESDDENTEDEEEDDDYDDNDDFDDDEDYDDDYTYSKNETSEYKNDVSEVIEPIKSEPDQDEIDKNNFLNELHNSLLEVYTELETTAIIRNIPSEKILELRNKLNKDWVSEIKYILWSIPSELKHQIQLLEIKIEGAKMHHMLTFQRNLLLGKIINSKSSDNGLYNLFKQKIQFEYDYDLLKKYGL